jgi:hypothetical protein
MKIKQDFVTNSSSTGFIFLFKGNQRTDLFEKMVKYGDKFKLYNEYHGSGGDYIDVWDLIKELDPILSSTKEDPWYLPGPTETSKLLEKLEDELKHTKETLKEELKNEKENPDKGWKSSNWTKDSLVDIEARLKKVKAAVECGLDHYVEVSFGDNDGMICGGKLGVTMDYSGRDIDLNQRDFKVMVENQH